MIEGLQYERNGCLYNCSNIGACTIQSRGANIDVHVCQCPSQYQCGGGTRADVANFCRDFFDQSWDCSMTWTFMFSSYTLITAMHFLVVIGVLWTTVAVLTHKSEVPARKFRVRRRSKSRSSPSKSAFYRKDQPKNPARQPLLMQEPNRSNSSRNAEQVAPAAVGNRTAVPQDKVSYGSSNDYRRNDSFSSIADNVTEKSPRMVGESSSGNTNYEGFGGDETGKSPKFEGKTERQAGRNKQRRPRKLRSVSPPLVLRMSPKRMVGSYSPPSKLRILQGSKQKEAGGDASSLTDTGNSGSPSYPGSSPNRSIHLHVSDVPHLRLPKASKPATRMRSTSESLRVILLRRRSHFALQRVSNSLAVTTLRRVAISLLLLASIGSGISIAVISNVDTRTFWMLDNISCAVLYLALTINVLCWRTIIQVSSENYNRDPSNPQSRKLRSKKRLATLINYTAISSVVLVSAGAISYILRLRIIFLGVLFFYNIGLTYAYAVFGFRAYHLLQGFPTSIIKGHCTLIARQSVGIGILTFSSMLCFGVMIYTSNNVSSIYSMFLYMTFRVIGSFMIILSSHCLWPIENIR